MRTNHNDSGKPSLEGCVGLRYPLRWVLQATYPWVCGILTFNIKKIEKWNGKLSKVTGGNAIVSLYGDEEAAGAADSENSEK